MPIQPPASFFFLSYLLLKVRGCPSGTGWIWGRITPPARSVRGPMGKPGRGRAAAARLCCLRGGERAGAGLVERLPEPEPLLSFRLSSAATDRGKSRANLARQGRQGCVWRGRRSGLPRVRGLWRPRGHLLWQPEPARVTSDGVWRACSADRVASVPDWAPGPRPRMGGRAGDFASKGTGRFPAGAPGEEGVSACREGERRRAGSARILL